MKNFAIALILMGSASYCFGMSRDVLRTDLNEQVIEAAHDGNVARLEALKAQRANIKDAVDDEFKASPLMHAIDDGHYNAVAWLLKEGVDVNKPNKYGTTPLHFACFNPGNDDIVRLLLDQEGIKIDTRNQMQESSLEMAAKTSKTYIELLTKALQEQGKKPKKTVRQPHKTALDLLTRPNLFVAIEADNMIKIEQFIQEASHLLDQRDPETRLTATLFAAKLGKLAIVDKFIRAGVPYNESFPYDKCLGSLDLRGACYVWGKEKGKDALTTLLEAYEQLFVYVAEDNATGLGELLEAKKLFIDVRYNFYDSKHQREKTETLLQCAVRKGASKCVATLLNKGASKDAKNSYHETALQIAQSQGDSTIAALLRSERILSE